MFKIGYMYFSVLATVVALSTFVAGHTYHLGNCPNVEPVPNFDMEKFLGKWYVIERTSSTSRDFVFVYSKEEGFNQYSVTQISTKTGLVGSILGQNWTEVGLLTLGEQQPARMAVKFPLNPSSYDYIVFMTDYETYAGIFACQEILGTNRRMINIISRQPSLDEMYLNKIKRRLSMYGVNTYDLSEIKQSENDRPLDIDVRTASGMFPNDDIDGP